MFILPSLQVRTEDAEVHAAAMRILMRIVDEETIKNLIKQVGWCPPVRLSACCL